MSAKPDGGAAFPIPAGQTIAGNHPPVRGMSLRDYFAAKALAALIGLEGKDYVNRGEKAVPILARFAYEYADAMLSERSKP